MSEKDSKNEKTIATAQQLSLFILFVALFLGTLFMFNGNLLIVLPVTIILVVVMYYIVWYMVGAKIGKKRSGFSIGDRMLWFVYAVISIPVTFIVLHAFNVEIQERATIEKLGLDKVRALRDLQNEYKKTYEMYLNQTEANMNFFIPNYLNGIYDATKLKQRIHVNDAFISGIDATNPTASVHSYISIERMKFQIADSSLFSDREKYLELQESKIRNFSRLSINFVLTDLDEKLKDSKQMLNNYLSNNTNGKRLDFNIEPYTKPTLIAQPWMLLKKQINPFVLVIMLLINGLMLLPYLMAPGKEYDPKGGSEGVDIW